MHIKSQIIKMYQDGYTIHEMAKSVQLDHEIIKEILGIKSKQLSFSAKESLDRIRQLEADLIINSKHPLYSVDGAIGLMMAETHRFLSLTF